MSYGTANASKANFDDVYTAPTPHAYVAAMAQCGYEIGEQARPYFTAAVDLLRERNGDAWPSQMLDLGCSYGLGSAFVKYGCSFDELVAFFATRAPREYHAVCEATRVWLHVTPEASPVRCVGLDASKPAIRFAVEAGLLDGGIARDLERPGATLTHDERAWFRSCNLLIGSGAIGYITERTLGQVLEGFGQDHPGSFGPLTVVTILRMFDPAPIRAAFERQGFQFEPVPGVRLPQRRFSDEAERRHVLSLLHDRGVETREWEEQGKLYADLFVGGPPEQLPVLRDRMAAVRVGSRKVAGAAVYIRR